MPLLVHFYNKATDLLTLEREFKDQSEFDLYLKIQPLKQTEYIIVY